MTRSEIRRPGHAVGKTSLSAIVTLSFLFYVSTGGLIGFLIEQKVTAEPMCWPRSAEFGILVSQCANAASGWAWFLVTDLPRLILEVPAVVLSEPRTSLRNGFEGDPLEQAISWVLLLIPVTIIAWVYWRNWRFRLWPVAALLLLVFIAEAVHLSASL